MELRDFPPHDFNDPETKQVRDYLEAFGRTFGEKLAASRHVKSWLFGPAPDGKSICGAFSLDSGETLEFSFSASDLDSFVGVLGFAARMAAEIAALHGEQDGNG
jgi:hypothetical protein